MKTDRNERRGAELFEESFGLTMKQVLVYELAASWWASWICIEWMQELTSRYYAWKVDRKWRRFQAMYERYERVHSKSKDGFLRK